MADQFADQFKRYWLVIVTVASGMLTLGGIQVSQIRAQYELSERITALETVVNINMQALSSFANQGPRYTLTDHAVYADRQAEINARQDERITILEQQNRSNTP